MDIFALDNNVHALVEKPVGVYTKQENELTLFAKTKPELKFGILQPAHQPAVRGPQRPHGLR
ncbi:hypothetical protein [Corynebacterium deserti]|uniref:hypothetical protein n=1 Tax=Corynebacterium deserti TaxID=1408191 RepID=UPI001E498D58|nr:hypothetical protein [Corynebacterium deserti]